MVSWFSQFTSIYAPCIFVVGTNPGCYRYMRWGADSVKKANGSKTCHDVTMRIFAGQQVLLKLDRSVGFLAFHWGVNLGLLVAVQNGIDIGWSGVAKGAQGQQLTRPNPASLVAQAAVDVDIFIFILLLSRKTFFLPFCLRRCLWKPKKHNHLFELHGTQNISNLFWGELKAGSEKLNAPAPGLQIFKTVWKFSEGDLAVLPVGMIR